MPTFREDLHLGHEVPMFDTDDINNGAVTTRKIADGAVTLPKLAPDTITYIANQISQAIAQLQQILNGDVDRLDGRIDETNAKHAGDIENINDELTELQHQIEAASQHGIAVSNEFGDDEYISISQKTLTDAINKLWDKISDITGEIIRGIDMTVTPDYFIGDDGADIHVVARTVDLNDHFEHIAFYANGVLIDEAEDVDYFECDTHLEGTSLIKCVAKILGIEYSREQVITHYESFWLGAADAWMPVINTSNLIAITEGMSGTHAVTCEDTEDGEYIFIIMGEYLRNGFYGATMSSVEIPLVEFPVSINHERYVVFRSVNKYEAGTYNIEFYGFKRKES